MSTWILILCGMLLLLCATLAGWVNNLQKKLQETDSRSLYLLEKQMEMKHEGDRIEALEKRLSEINELLPKDARGELLRSHILLQQHNDEMERSLNMEKEFNDGLASILNYGRPDRGDQV